MSSDPSGEAASVERQRTACRALVEARGWQLVRSFADNDISAYSGARRPGFESLAAAVTSRDVDVVVVWKLDRLVRRPSEFETFWKVCEIAQVQLLSVTEPIDSTTELGLALVRVLVTFASLESATKSVRLRAANADRARRGHPPSQRRAFGVNHGWTELVPAEADEVRRAAARLLDGATLDSVERDWAQRGIRTARGGIFVSGVIKKMLLSPRMVGDREHHGEVVATDCFPAILDRRVWERLVIVLSDSARRPMPATTAHLLGGILTCGRCGATLKFSRSRGRGTYACSSRRPTCTGVSIVASSIEQHIESRLLDHQPTEAPATEPAVALDIARRLRYLNHDYYATDHIDRQQYLRLRQRLLDRIPPAPTPEAVPTPERWASLTVQDRRAALQLFIARVEIAPAYKTGSFDPGRATIVWWDTLRAGQTPKGASPFTHLYAVARPRPPGRGPWLAFNTARELAGDLAPQAFARLLLERRVPVYRNGAQLRVRRPDLERLVDSARLPHRP